MRVGKFGRGKISPHANPKAYTASHTHCTAKARRFRQEKIASFLEDRISPPNNPGPKLRPL